MNDVEDYVEEIEYRKVGVGHVDPEEADWLVLHCTSGDMYQSFWEDGGQFGTGWWIQLFQGDPSQGPYESIEDVVDMLNGEC